jgi:predicted O-methyltransferase YrrM
MVLLVLLHSTKLSGQVAKHNISNAGLSTKVKIIIGSAIDSLVAMHPNTPFDLIFIDADKPSNLPYFTEAKRLARKGGVIVRDRH